MSFSGDIFRAPPRNSFSGPVVLLATASWSSRQIGVSQEWRSLVRRSGSLRTIKRDTTSALAKLVQWDLSRAAKSPLKSPQTQGMQRNAHTYIYIYLYINAPPNTLLRHFRLVAPSFAIIIDERNLSHPPKVAALVRLICKLALLASSPKYVFCLSVCLFVRTPELQLW